MYIFIHMYIHVYIYINIYIHIHAYIHIYLYIYSCTYMYTLCTDVNENADELVKACISVALEPIVMVNSKLHVCSII